MPTLRATRKRSADEQPPAAAVPARQKRRAVTAVRKEEDAGAKAQVAVPRKPTLFDDLDGSPAAKKNGGGSSNIAYLQSLDDVDDDAASDSSLSDLDDADFEPKPSTKAGKAAKATNAKPKPPTTAKGKPKKPPVKKGQYEKTTSVTQRKPPIQKVPKDGIVPRRPTLFDDLDGSPAAKSKRRSSNLDYLHSLDADADDAASDSSSSLSDIDIDNVDFEDVPLQQTREGSANDSDDGSDDGSDDDDDMEFEDVAAPAPAPFSFLSMAIDHEGGAAGTDEGNLELTLIKDTRVSLTALHAADSKKGPSKMERLVRSATHCVHVQSLLYHNALRNAWMCDAEVQGLLLSHLPPRLHEEVERWQRLSGRLSGPAADVQGAQEKSGKKGKASDKKGNKQGDKQGDKKGNKKDNKKRGSDWSSAVRVEQTAADLSHSDPLLRLLRVLSSWWRQAFRITAPGLRKTGYMTLERLDRFLKAAKERRGIDTEDYKYKFGERIRHVADMRGHAARLEGSRDVGAQLFTALLRALGLEARMVASLQPLGFGWNKLEDADAEVDEDVKGYVDETSEAPTPRTPTTTSKVHSTTSTPKRNAARKAAIVIDSDDAGDDLELEEVNSDNDSVVVDLPQISTDRRSTTGRPRFDQDLPYAVYWTEVLSPVRQKYIPIDALVKRVVATTRELVEASFEPRGGKAEKARQVMGYVVGYAADGTAKDVTVRYLKRQMLPGRTRGVRFPVEKVPVYNKHGKVRRYELADWFRQSVMRGYARGFSAACPVTELDEAEDSTDLKPAQPEKKEVKEGEETLQYYKQSAEYVLERHLKREEALVAGAPVVKYFRNPKQKKEKRKHEAGDAGNAGDEEGETGETGEKVYRRKDVVPVKSAETWHKQGRAPRAGEQPLKQVPYRAATLNRKREIAEAEAATGGKVLQGLFSEAQTDWIIPPPIRDGVIPKNAYGNIDLFAEHMCPAGAVHVPFRGAPRVCRKLGIDFAEAVVGFEFGHRMAVPVIQGVVVAEENYERLVEQLEKDEAERARKEDEKRRGKAMGMWRKMLMGLRVVERIRQEYGEVREVVDVEDGEDKGEREAGEREALPEGYEYEDEEEHASSFFPVEDDDDVGGGFIVE